MSGLASVRLPGQADGVRVIDDLAGAAMLLTRLPVSRLTATPAPPLRAVWAYPVVGAAVGAIGGGAWWAARWLGLPPGAGAVAALAAMWLATGALHEDGLADTADGLFGGATAERRLAIMRDSRIGTFGTLALIVAALFRVAAIAALPAGAVLPGLAAAAAAARAAMLGPLAALPPARGDGLGAMVAGAPAAGCATGIALAAALAFAVLPAGRAAVLLAACAVAAALVGAAARRRIGGMTGDILGAVAVVAECAALGVLSAH